MKHSTPLIIHLVLVSTVVLVALVGYYMVFSEIREKNTHIAEVTNDVDSSLKKEAALESLKKIVADTKTDREKLTTYFIGKDDAAHFIETLEKLARDRAVDFNVVSVGEEALGSTVSGDVSLLKLRLETKGSWSAMMNLYGLFEKLPYKVAVGSLQLSRVTDETTKTKTTPLWKGSIELSVVQLK